jgi:hypothetical protein
MMKNWKMIIGLTLLPLLLVSVAVGMSRVYSQPLAHPQANENMELDEKQEPFEGAYEMWHLALRYNYEEKTEENAYHSGLKAIADLRGDRLRYFLDFLQAIRQTQMAMSCIGAYPMMSTSGKWELHQIITATIFPDVVESHNHRSFKKDELAYATQLQEVVGAILAGNGDDFLDSTYVETIRPTMISFTEDTGVGLFGAEYAESIFDYLEQNGVSLSQPSDEYNTLSLCD